ncbi:uncharacterized protein [Montipora capricornis]|uniref:uncharacterized protein isoform X2 n=1 Tax=Montipora capricornis TaxID=246305 RepID=UPI0035F1F286
MLTEYKSSYLRPEQRQAVEALLQGRERELPGQGDVLAVLPTGYGKSLIFQVYVAASALIKSESASNRKKGQMVNAMQVLCYSFSRGVWELNSRPSDRFVSGNDKQRLYCIHPPGSYNDQGLRGQTPGFASPSSQCLQRQKCIYQ